MNLRDLTEHAMLHGLGQRSFRCMGGLFAALAGFCGAQVSGVAEVPALLNYQGRITVGSIPFNGSGQFKAALVNNGASQVYWRNSPDANNDGEPDNAISIAVTKGLYSFLLGDTSLQNMAALPATIFSNGEIYLRVWFNDGARGFQQLSPDKRIASVGYAMVAETVADGSVTSQKLEAELAATITRLTEQVSALSTRLEEVENAATGGSITVSTDAEDEALIAGGYQLFNSTTALPWSAGPDSGVPAGRTGHSVVWSGEEMLVWGGYLGNGIYANSGGGYDPGENSWRPATTFGAPSGRQSHSAIWTGTGMLIWGGLTANGYANTGALYQPETEDWKAIANLDSPAARGDHAAVWTGSKMIVWGGRGAAGYYSDGGLYNPALNQWSPLVLTGAPEARHSAAAVWTGDRMVVWGGEGVVGPINSGGRLIVESEGTTHRWETVSSAGAPSPRAGHSAVWTGSKVIVWGGQNGSSFHGDGAMYDPVADTWNALPASGAPSGRSGHVAAWTGTEMIVQGGKDSSGALSSGGAYDPASNTWRPLNTAGNPVARTGAKAAWSGRELMVFGGQAGGQPLAALQRLNPQPAWHFYRKL